VKVFVSLAETVMFLMNIRPMCRLQYCFYALTAQWTSLLEKINFLQVLGFSFFKDFNVTNAEHRYMTHHKYMKEISLLIPNVISVAIQI